MSRAARKDAVPILLDHLDDSSPSILRAIRHELNPHLHEVPDNRITNLAASGANQAARKNAVDLLSDMSKWRSIPCLLEAMAIGDSSVRLQSENYLLRWFAPERYNKVFTRPTPAERDRIYSVLTQHAKGLPAVLVESVKQEVVRFD